MTDAEKKMSALEFIDHLQSLFRKKNVKKIAFKLKKWCEQNEKDFSPERLKGWVSGETEEMTDEEFLALFEEENEAGNLPDEKTNEQ